MIKCHTVLKKVKAIIDTRVRAQLAGRRGRIKRIREPQGSRQLVGRMMDDAFRDTDTHKTSNGLDAYAEIIVWI